MTSPFVRFHSKVAAAQPVHLAALEPDRPAQDGLTSCAYDPNRIKYALKVWLRVLADPSYP